MPDAAESNNARIIGVITEADVFCAERITEEEERGLLFLIALGDFFLDFDCTGFAVREATVFWEDRFLSDVFFLDFIVQSRVKSD